MYKISLFRIYSLLFFVLSYTCITAIIPDSFHELWSQLRYTQPKNDYSHLTNNDIIPESDISDKNRTIWIITTACLPWMTGTSINPLLRAAYLTKDRLPGKVNLVVPWLPKEDQELTYPNSIRFSTPQEQKEYVYNWLIHDANMSQAAEKLNITFYSARYHDEYHSIFPMGDVSDLIPDELADVCVLEEPEHLNWFKAPFTAKAWMDKFKHVIGIIHTNYVMYSKSFALGHLTGPILHCINQGICRAYCHKIIKLSSTLPEFAVEKEVVSNVHGVRSKYLNVGDLMSRKKFHKGAYFIGKMAWPKGLNELFSLMNFVQKRTGKCFHMDLYGSGPHFDEIKDSAKRMKLPTTFFGAKDHSLLSEYKVFVNPSLSEVLCTTIVEALAMGKWVVCPKHPSNEFFEQFPNCLIYRNEEEFAANVYWALNNNPQPLSPEQRYTLSWEAATERFIAASKITKEMQLKSNRYTDKFIAWLIEMLGKGKHGDMLRYLAGGKTAAKQMEYMNKYGSAIPIPVLSEEEIDNLQKSFDNIATTATFEDDIEVQGQL